MAPVVVGDRVGISGIGGRPQLNGMFGVVTGGAPNGRMYVRLENIEQETVSLKPDNLSRVSGGSGGSGGSSGSSASGGGGSAAGSSGSGGGIIQRVVAMAYAEAERMKGQLQNALPPATPPQVLLAINGMTPLQILAAAGLLAGSVVYYMSSWVGLPVAGLLCILCFILTQTEGGKRALNSLAAKLSAVSGRPISSTMVLGLLCAMAALLGRRYFGTPTSSSGGYGSGGYGGDEFEPLSPREAYSKGFEDAKAGKDFSAPSGHYMPADSGTSASAESGFGIFKIMRYGFVANSIYRLGGGGGGAGWSMQAAIFNAQQNPMQAAMIAMMVMF